MDYSEVCEYPDSNKVYIAKINKVFQQGKEVPYMTDEEDPRRNWDEESLIKYLEEPSGGKNTTTALDER
jgi:hypothetical protein